MPIGRFISLKTKSFFTGDMGVDRFGPWYGWATCDLRHLVASILHLRGLPVDVLLTSHGGMLTSRIDAAWNQALRHLFKTETGGGDPPGRRSPSGNDCSGRCFFLTENEVPDPMRSFLTMWDTAMYDHHRQLIEQGGLAHFFPELAALVPEPSP